MMICSPFKINRVLSAYVSMQLAAFSMAADQVGIAGAFSQFIGFLDYIFLKSIIGLSYRPSDWVAFMPVQPAAVFTW